MDSKTFVPLLHALAEPTRLEAVSLLSVEKRCACQLLERLHVSQSTLSHHMNVLVASGLVRAEPRGRWVFYGIDPAVAAELAGFFTSLGKDAPAAVACSGDR